MSDAEHKPESVVISRSNGASIIVSATVSDAHQAQVELTKHPVAVGVDASDHARRMPKRFTIEGVFAQPEVDGRASAQDTIAVLYDVLEAVELVTITTPRRTLESMVLVSLSEPRDASTGRGVKFSATFEQLRFVTSQSTSLPVSKYALDAEVKGSKKVDQGHKAARLATPAEKAKATESANSISYDAIQSAKKGLFGR